MNDKPIIMSTESVKSIDSEELQRNNERDFTKASIAEVLRLLSITSNKQKITRMSLEARLETEMDRLEKLENHDK